MLSGGLLILRQVPGTPARSLHSGTGLIFLQGDENMADSTPTRAETVAANNAATISKYGEEAWYQIIAQRLKDISDSLAMLVDNDTTSST